MARDACHHDDPTGTFARTCLTPAGNVDSRKAAAFYKAQVHARDRRIASLKKSNAELRKELDVQHERCLCLSRRVDGLLAKLRKEREDRGRQVRATAMARVSREERAALVGA